MTLQASLAPLTQPLGRQPSHAAVVRKARPPEASTHRPLDPAREAIRARHSTRSPADRPYAS